MSFKQKQARARAKVKINRIISFLSKDQKILDVGCGNGAVCKILSEKGFDIQPLDVKNKSCFPEISPVIYDGKHMHFQDKSFDTSLLLTILHHTESPEEIIKEASRVASTIIIMEDIYENHFQKYLTFFVDSIVNWEFINHPHSNKTDLEWKSLFNELGLNLSYEIKHPGFLYFFYQITYVLKV